jgi:hypothetical protein
MPTALQQADRCAKMLLSVHDESDFKVPTSEVGVIAAIVKQVMETAGAPDSTSLYPSSSRPSRADAPGEYPSIRCMFSASVW